MILQSLVKLYEQLHRRGDIVGAGWCKAKVTYQLELDKHGELVGTISMRVPEQRGKKTVDVPRMLIVPEQNKKSNGVTPNFLCDTPKYFLGIDNSENPKKIEKARECFNASRVLHHSVLDGCTSRTAQAVLHFFDTWHPEKANDNLVLKADWEAILGAGNMIFCVDGINAEDDEEISQAWERYRQDIVEDDTVTRAQCLVTGKENQPIARLHPNIKGVRGAQSSGASLVSFNAPAFESYGNEEAQGLNAPVSQYAAFAYTTALNTLLSDPDHVEMLGGTTMVYWSEYVKPTCQRLFRTGIVGADEYITDKILDSIMKDFAKGIESDLGAVKINPEEPFYILGLAPNAARLSVRFFLGNTFGYFMMQLMEHQERMKLGGSFKNGQTMIPFWLLLKQTVNPHSKDSASSPLLVGELLRSVLSAEKYPEALYQNIMLRIFSDQDEYNDHGTRIFDKVGRVRAAFVKAYLLKNHSSKWEGNITMTVNDECNEMSYVLGRLFAVLENIQQSANPNINATIKGSLSNVGV